MFGCGVFAVIIFLIFVSEPFLPILLINGEVIHFPIVCEFGHRFTRIREMDSIADLPIGDVERSDTKVSAEIASGGKIFAPVETLIENVSAKAVEILFYCHTT